MPLRAGRGKARWTILLLALLAGWGRGVAAQDRRSVLPMETGEQRDRRGEAARVLDLLQAGAGQRAAVLGAGDGYFVFRLAQRLGPTAELIAEDSDPGWLAELRLRLDRAGLPSVRLVNGTLNDPGLPPASVDLAVADHLVGYLPEPVGFFRRVRQALAAGGRLAVVDGVGWAGGAGPTPAGVRCLLTAAGFREVAYQPLLPAGNWVLVVTPTDRDAPVPAPDCPR